MRPPCSAWGGWIGTPAPSRGGWPAGDSDVMWQDLGGWPELPAGPHGHLLLRPGGRSGAALCVGDPLPVVFPQMSEADGPGRAAASGSLHKPVAVQGGPGRSAARPAQGRAHLQRPAAAPARVPAQQLAPAQGDLQQGQPQPPAWHLQAASCVGLEPGLSDLRAVPGSPSPLLPITGPPVSQSRGACCPEVKPAGLGECLAPAGP